MDVYGWSDLLLGEWFLDCWLRRLLLLGYLQHRLSAAVRVSTRGVEVRMDKVVMRHTFFFGGIAAEP
jgi:hypothetical protein